jgi:hypothetical protein
MAMLCCGACQFVFQTEQGNARSIFTPNRYGCDTPTFGRLANGNKVKVRAAFQQHQQAFI